METYLYIKKEKKNCIKKKGHLDKILVKFSDRGVSKNYKSVIILRD